MMFCWAVGLTQFFLFNGRQACPGCLVDNIPKGYNKFSYTATAFFIDREGRMGTNRHVAYPWDKAYMNPETEDMLRQAIEEFLEELIPTKKK